MQLYLEQLGLNAGDRCPMEDIKVCDKVTPMNVKKVLMEVLE